MNFLFLRGLVREQRHWGPFLKDFEAKAKKLDSSATVHALDFPGFGTERERLSPTSIPEIVEDTRKRFLTLKATHSGPWTLVAISLGGMVALEWLSKNSHDFEKLILINSSLAGLSPFYERLKPARYPRIFSLFFVKDVLKREQAVLKMTTNLNQNEINQRAQFFASEIPAVKRENALRQLAAATRFRAPERIETPMLVLSSLGDRLVNPKCSVRIAQKYRASHHIHPTANHDLPADDPAWIEGEIFGFVNRKDQLNT